MDSSKVKGGQKSKELDVRPQKAYYEPQEPNRVRLKKVKIIDMDDTLKRIYRIRN